MLPENAKIYIAGSLSNREKYENWTKQLRQKLRLVVSTWHIRDDSHLDLEEIASRDIYDLEEANTLVFDIVPTSKGGRHVEFGYALAMEKEIHIIGEELQNAFQHHPDVYVWKTWEEFVADIEV